MTTKNEQPKNSLVPVTKALRPEKLSPLELYLREISKYPLLEPEEEYELAIKNLRQGDREAAHRLVTSNLRLVVKIANDFRKAQGNLLDLIQEGNYGLIQAVARFNPYKGVKLSSYASWWIRAYILKHLMDTRSQVKIGTTAAQRKLYYNLKKEAEKLLKEYDTVDTKLLAEHLNVKEKDVVEMQQRLSAPDLSLDAPVGEEDSGLKNIEILDTTLEEDSIENKLAAKELESLMREDINSFKKTLSGRDLEIFNLRLDSDEPLTLQEIGDKYSITRERARQLEARVLKKLKEFVKNQGNIDIEIEEIKS